MAKVKPPFHTKKRTKVYHDNNECTLGDNIQPENCIHGKGDKRLCTKCKKLNKNGK